MINLKQPIKKDDRKLRLISDFKGVEEKYYDGLRLAEQPVNVCQDIVDSSASSYVSYIDNLINLSKKCE